MGAAYALKEKFTYHIVNIKRMHEIQFKILDNEFTYHIVNIKQKALNLAMRMNPIFTYHIVNIKLYRDSVGVKTLG